MVKETRHTSMEDMMGDVAAAITDDGNSNPYSKWKTRASTAKERKKII